MPTPAYMLVGTHTSASLLHCHSAKIKLSVQVHTQHAGSIEYDSQNNQSFKNTQPTLGY